MKKLLYLTLIILITSCSIAKRHYRSGYHIEWNKSGNETGSKTSEKVTKQEIKVSLNNEEVTPEYSAEVASVNNVSIFKESKRLKNFLNILNEECDVLILKNGEEVKVKVIEITQTEIKYKKCDFQTGPLITIDKSEVFMIKYSNGSKDIIKVQEKNHAAAHTEAKVEPKAHPLAVLSLVFGIVSLLLSFITIYGVLVLAILAIIFGGVALRKIKQHPETYIGKGMATAGIICGILALLIFIILIGQLLRLYS